MSEQTAYTLYHPRWHRTRVSTYWWLGRWSYFLFILRELSSLCVGWFVVYLLLLVDAVHDGAPAYGQFVAWSRSPALLTVNIVSLLFVCLHAVTWFNLAPQAMVLRVGHLRVPGWAIAAANYAAGVVVWAALLVLLLEWW